MGCLSKRPSFFEAGTRLHAIRIDPSSHQTSKPTILVFTVINMNLNMCTCDHWNAPDPQNIAPRHPNKVKRYPKTSFASQASQHGFHDIKSIPIQWNLKYPSLCLVISPRSDAPHKLNISLSAHSVPILDPRPRPEMRYAR